MVEIFLLNHYEFIFLRQLQCPSLPLMDVVAKPVPKNSTFLVQPGEKLLRTAAA